MTYAKDEATFEPRADRTPLLTATNVTDEGLMFAGLIQVPSGRVSPKQLLRKGDVVVVTSSGSLTVVGKAWALKAEFRGTFGAFCKVLRPHGYIDPNFFGHYFRTQAYRHRVSTLAAGANINNLRSEHLDDLVFPLPPLPEQRRIAAILDQADALRAKRRVVVGETHALEQATFEQQVGRAGIWPERAIGDLAHSIRTGPFGSQLLHSEFVDDGIAVLGIDNAVTNTFAWGERRFITETKYRNLSRFRVYPRDVIITIMGTCGRAAVVPDEIPLAITTKHLCSITLDETVCLPEFLHACLLRHPAVLKQLGVTARGAVMPGLNMGLIKATMIPLPPLSVQKEFATRQREIAVNRNRFEKSKGMLDSLFASLQHRAFRGEL